MSRIKGQNTKPEMIVRKFLHSRGFRFRLHSKNLPGKPDIVLKKYGVVIFVHGCFWHRHRDCRYSTTPATNSEKWLKKFSENVARDARQREELVNSGWRVLVIWACGLKHCIQDVEKFVVFIEGSEKEKTWPKTPPLQK